MTTEYEGLVFSDTLDGAFDPGWTWLREHPGFWRLQDGLEIRVEPGAAATVQNALLRPAPDRNEGTWAIEVTVYNHTHPIQQWEQAGITWYRNGKPIFKHVKELIDGDLYIIPGRKPMPTQGVRLRLVVTADSWEAQYRPEARTNSTPRIGASCLRPATIKSASSATTAPRTPSTGSAFGTFRSNA